MAVDQDTRATLPSPKVNIKPEPLTIRWLTDRCANPYRRLTEQPLSLYGTAILRIGFGLIYFVFLLREYPNRSTLWGPDSPWTPVLARQIYHETGWNSLLTVTNNWAYFEAFYVGALIVAFLFLLGWRTRFVSILFAVVVASFYARNPLATDGGDTLMLLMAIYLCFTVCGRRWSLDARRARQRFSRYRASDTATPVAPPGQVELVRRFAVTVVHNCALLIVGAQMCILYGAASLYKVQGSMWDDGTALHYVLHLDLFRPWPWLSDFMDGQFILVTIASYFTVLIQIAFPFSLFSKLKYIILPILTSMHLGIAVVMGLPFFSGVMIVADAVFLPDGFYITAARLWRRHALSRLRRLRGHSIH